MQAQSTLSITGPDAFEFLQGQLTNDLKRLQGEAEILTAWCNPKGRVILLSAIKAVDSGYNLSAPANMADAIVKRLTMFRFRSNVDIGVSVAEQSVDPSDYIRRGIPIIGSLQSEKFTPHMLNLDLLDAISLDKGCYTGQEIVARTHYKGATKRRTLRFESSAPVSPGAKVSFDERDIGEVLNATGNDLLAIIPTAKAGGQLNVGTAQLTAVDLPYAIGSQ